MKRPDFQTWSKKVRQQPLMEAGPSELFDAESWIIDGELLKAKVSDIKPSTLDELIKAGLVEK
jgi:hypothetical protein